MTATQKMYRNVPTPAMQIGLAVSTPDGGFLYAGNRCINFIEKPPGPCQVKTMSTRINVNALDVSPMWGKPNEKTKPFAILAEDLTVQVWDCELGEAVSGHKAHQHQQESARNMRYHANHVKIVLMGYLSNGNILSVDATDLVIYCVASNTYCRRPNFIPPKNHTGNLLKCSPYSEHIFALGTVMGNVLVCDLRKMSILHKFVGHKAKICGLAWREIKQDQREKDNKMGQLALDAEQWRNRNGQNADKAPSAKTLAAEERSNKQKSGKASPSLLVKANAIEDASEAFDIYNFDHLKDEFGAPSDKSLTKSSEDVNEFVGIEKPADDKSKFDFMEACKSMKDDLNALKLSDAVSNEVEVTLQDCQEAKLTAGSPPRSDDEEENDDSKSGTLKDVADSSEGSMEVIQYSSSSDDAVIVDGDAAKPKREVLHHIYHQAEVHETPPEAVGQDQEQPPATQTNAAQMTRQESFDTLSSISMASAQHTDILLVSIDADDIIIVSNTSTGAFCGKSYCKYKGSGKMTNVQWLNDSTIVTMSHSQLFYWSLIYDEKLLRYKIAKSHDRMCYQRDIIAFSCSPIKGQIWICMTTRTIALMDSGNGLLTDTFGTVAFGVRALAECPEDMNKIALGCSDRRIAFLDVFKLSTRSLVIDMITTTSPIYSLAWSPNCLSLAFGTGDGVVGIIDVERMRIKELHRSPYKSEIYSLMWLNNYIYFVTNHLFCYINMDKARREVQHLDYINKPSFFNAREGFLLVGTSDGFLELYKRKDCPDLGYTFSGRSALMSRYITDIAWNPNEPQQFAVVGNDKPIYIMEYSESEMNIKKLHTFTASAPKASVTSLKWSHRQSHVLATFHIEGKVCLWSTKEPEKPPLTISYHCPMWGGMFLPTSDNIIMCFGKSISLELVNIEEANETRVIQSKFDALSKVKWATKSITQPIIPNACLSAKEKKRQNRDKRKSEKMAAEKEIKEHQHEVKEIAKETHVEDMITKLSLDSKPTYEQPPQSVLGNSRTCLYLVQKEINRDALEKLAIVLTEDSSKIDKSVFISKLFSTKVVAKDLLASELTNLKQTNKKDIGPLCLAVSTFKLREELEQHMANQTLNEWHLSLAPSVSFMFWQDCCRSYAKQMENMGYILHAATYLFGIGLQKEAVDLLVEQEYYKEALLHARICLPATDPIIKTIINKWLENLEKYGNYAAAALICILDNEMLRGYTYLRKYHKCTPEISRLMEDIKRIGQLNGVLDGCLFAGGPNSNASETVESTEN
ncbi:LOW QUALITY PROTEIN: protein rigor mortis [Drosophila tropicalis]|uniref:LOW QUALITY PROTEIN: protein rigor mortis n=1 Tax=Drosophila tropicalis TaxID=46794 RepID=UPI0035AB9ACC